MKHNYPADTTKHESTKTEAELMAIREKYRNGVPQEVIDHIADVLLEELMPQDNEARIEKPVVTPRRYVE